MTVWTASELAALSVMTYCRVKQGAPQPGCRQASAEAAEMQGTMQWGCYTAVKQSRIDV